MAPRVSRPSFARTTRTLAKGGAKGEGYSTHGDSSITVCCRIARTNHDGDADKNNRGPHELSVRQPFAARRGEETRKDRCGGSENQGAVCAESADGGKEQGVTDGETDDAGQSDETEIAR